MQKNNVFEIKNLECTYDNKKVVLQIDDLSIPKGALVAVVGGSGSGKTTLLETLGLMRKTYTKESQISFFSEDCVPISYARLQSNGNGNGRGFDELRCKHFSFIFQETVMMENFTAIENTCLPLLHQGKNWNDSYTLVWDMLNKVGLSDVVKNNTLPSKLSGGQRQRLAFIRAILSQHSVIFGDEPTGNLDHKAANNIFTVLAQHTMNQQSKTVIIVTHDLSLATKFADLIIVIPNKVGDSLGIYKRQKKDVEGDSSRNEEDYLVKQGRFSKDNISEIIESMKRSHIID